MKHAARRFTFATALPALLAVIVLAGSAVAQLPQTKLKSIFPPGGKQGAKFDVRLTGSDFEEVYKLQFSHPGITVAAKMSDGKNPQPISGQFTVSIAANVPPGLYEARATGYWGLTNARAFSVSNQDEVIEQGTHNKIESAMQVPLEAIVNGTADAANYDYYKFTAKRGQRVIIDCQAYRIDSRMDPSMVLYNVQGLQLESARDTVRRDALIDFTVPADGDYYVKVYDFLYRGGSDYFYRLSISTRPYVDFIFPPAGKPGASGKFTVYGRNLPGGTAAPGVTVDGKTLQKLDVTIALPGDAAAKSKLVMAGYVAPRESGQDGIVYRVKGPQGESNPVQIGFAAAPIVLEKEPNDDPAKAQKVTVPCEIAGQFNPRRDRDWYTFDAKKGDVYWVDVLSQRLGTPADPYFLVLRIDKDDKGALKESLIQEMDDLTTAKGNTPIRFDTGTTDPAYRFEVKQDATYRILVRHQGSQCDPRYVYRLAIRKEQPDFRLIAVPERLTVGNPNNNQVFSSTAFLRKGGSAAMKVLAFRRDGYKGEIQLTAQGLPPGVTCPTVTMGANAKSAMLVFSAAANAPAWSGAIKIVGKGKVNGADVTRTVRSGEVTWDVTAINNGDIVQSRMAGDIALSVADKEAALATVTAGDGKMLETSIAGKLEIPVKVVWSGKEKADMKFTPVGLVAGPKAAALTIKAAAANGKLTIDFKGNNIPIGTFSFCLKGEANINYSRAPERAKALEAVSKAVAAEAAKLAATLKAATAEKQKTDTTATAAAAKAKQTETARAAATKALADSQTAAKAAAVKLKQAQDALQKKTTDQNLVNAKNQAAKADTDAKAKVTVATTAKTAADKAVVDAKAAAKKATDAKAVNDKQATDADAASKKAEADKKAAADKAKAASDAAKPKKINMAFVSTPITVKIAPSPITLAASPAGTVKQGAKLEVPVNINRLFGFAEAVQISAKPASGVSGVSVKKATIAKGQNAGKLELTASAKATPGEHELVIEASLSLNGQNIKTSQTIKFKVEEVKKAAKKK
ncbi:MAG: PPC domain-containing protein [Planctomycetes bacterium]|nr:PPC domain-containing protein [Planctomycetota bacterium]